MPNGAVGRTVGGTDERGVWEGGLHDDDNDVCW